MNSRLSSERAFHDHQARERSAYLQSRPGSLCFRDDAYLDHETWIRPAFQELGDVAAQPVLDYGCGHGMAAVVLARWGAQVTALDLSPAYLNEANARAQANGVRIDCVQADAQRLPFAAGSFQAIWGNAILHHLDVTVAARELFRVLRPGGRAVLCEPWGENPLLRWARRRLPYPGKGHTPDEQPLRRHQVRLLRQVFPWVELRGYQFLAMARRLLPPGRFVRELERCDGRLLQEVPALQHFCRYVVLTLHR